MVGPVVHGSKKAGCRQGGLKVGAGATDLQFRSSSMRRTLHCQSDTFSVSGSGFAGLNCLPCQACLQELFAVLISRSGLHFLTVAPSSAGYFLSILLPWQRSQSPNGTFACDGNW